MRAARLEARGIRKVNFSEKFQIPANLSPMKTLVLFAALAATIMSSIALTSPPVLAAPATKANYLAPDKSFKVYFRAKPTIENETEKDPDVGTIKTQTFSEDSGALSYVLITMRFSGVPSLNEMPPKMLFDDYEKAFAQELGGKVAGRRQLKVGGFPARETLVDVGNIRFQLRVIIGRTTLFQAFTGGLKKDLASNKADANRFFDSFVILKP